MNSTAFTIKSSKKSKTYIWSPQQPRQRTSLWQINQFLFQQVAKDPFSLAAATAEFLEPMQLLY